VISGMGRVEIFLTLFPSAMPLDWALGCYKDVSPVVGARVRGLRIRLFLISKCKFY
jgi:hypothetical protein